MLTVLPQKLKQVPDTIKPRILIREPGFSFYSSGYLRRVKANVHYLDIRTEFNVKGILKGEEPPQVTPKWLLTRKLMAYFPSYSSTIRSDIPSERPIDGTDDIDHHGFTKNILAYPMLKNSFKSIPR